MNDPDAPAPGLLKVSTVAQLLECSPWTVRRRIADGSISAVDEHGRMMVRTDELRAYIDELARVGPARPRRRPRRNRDYGFLTE
jgi:hypothetical protein